MDDLTQTLKRETFTSIGRQFNGKAIVITGKPTGTRSNEIRATINLGANIQCEIERAEYDGIKDRIKAAQEKGEELTFSGRALTHAQNLVLRDCRLVEPPPKEEDAERD